MKAGWQVKKLGEVCELINRGISPSYLDDGGICVINQKCIRDHVINYGLARRHDTSVKQVSLDRFIRQGDVLVNSTGTGTLGRVAQVREMPTEITTVDSHVTIVRPMQERFSCPFFGYMLINIEDNIKERGEGCGGQTELARSVLANDFAISYPLSLPEQQHIVAILDETFDCIATAKANAEQNLKNAWEVFDSYLQSVFAQRGEGWVEKKLGDSSILDIIDGDRGNNYPKSHDFADEGYCLFLNTKNVRPDGFEFNETMFITEEKDKQLRKGKLQRHDVVMTTRGTIGNIGLYSENVEYEHVRINSGMLILRVNQSVIRPEFLFELLRSTIIKSQIVKHVSGAAQPQLPIKTLVNFTIPVPVDLAAQRAIVARLDALSTETQRLESIYRQKIVALDELKQSLLQRAFAGEL